MDAGSPRPSRRRLLIGGAELAAAVALGGCTSPTGPGTPRASVPQATSAAAPTPSAPLGPGPESPRFDLSAPPVVLLKDLALHETRRTMQGIAFDIRNRRLFVSQRRDGTPGADLCINQLSPTGRLLGHLHVDDAGHGQSFGVEPVGSASYLWLEWGANENSDAGRGTALARFRFQPGRRPAVQLFFDDGVEVGCALDPVNRRLLIRRPEDGRTVYTLFDLHDGAPGALRARFSEPPAIYARGGPPVLQAFTVLGRYAYTFTGTAGHRGTAADPFDSLLACIDVTTGEVVQAHLVTIGRQLVSREPEGLAIDLHGGSPRLVFGLSSRPGAGTPLPVADLFQLDRLA